MYDPTIGRWITEDPIGFEAADPNLYRYVGNNPTSRVDPSGLEAQPEIINGTSGQQQPQTPPQARPQPQILIFPASQPPPQPGQTPQIINGNSGPGPQIVITHTGPVDWASARLVQENWSVGDFGRGQRYQVRYGGGFGIIEAWRPYNQREELRYWCHGFTFGGAGAPGGPFSLTASGVAEVLARSYRQIIDAREVRPSDIVVWHRDGEIVHSAVLVDVSAMEDFDGRIQLHPDRTLLMSKNGPRPLGLITLGSFFQDYRNAYGTDIRVYRER